MPKLNTSIRISQDTKDLLAKLQAHLSMSAGSVIALAVRELANKYSIK